VNGSDSVAAGGSRTTPTARDGVGMTMSKGAAARRDADRSTSWGAALRFGTADLRMNRPAGRFTSSAATMASEGCRSMATPPFRIYR
jgi:hypothetical protein